MAKETIAGLAQRLGISKASVSYALNGQPGVSELTRRRVLDLADELGWYPSPPPVPSPGPGQAPWGWCCPRTPS
jgi:hypothetical protein